MVAAATALTPFGNGDRNCDGTLTRVANHPCMKPKTRWPTSNPVTPAPNSVTMPERSPADQPRIARIQAEHIEHIPEVETCGLHPDLHLARGRRGHFESRSDEGCRSRRVRSAPGRNRLLAVPRDGRLRAHGSSRGTKYFPCRSASSGSSTGAPSRPASAAHGSHRICRSRPACNAGPVAR